MRELYVYWKLPPGRQAEAVERVRSLQAGLAEAHPGLEARVLARSDLSSGGQATLMETYARPSSPEGVDAGLQQAIESAAAASLAGLGAGPRHIEAFDDLTGQA